MRCEHIQRQFSRARDGDLSRRQRDRLAKHLKRCAACREEYRQLGRSCRLLQRADAARGAEMPALLADAVVARLQREMPLAAKRARWGRVDARVALGIAATLALLLWGDQLHLLGQMPDMDAGQVARRER